MPSLVPRYSVTVVRDGVHVTPPIGKAFDFTASEVKEVRAHRHDALRKPINENDETVARTETDASLRGMKSPEADEAHDANLLSRAKPTGGKKARNSGGSLEEGAAGFGGRRAEDEPDPGVPHDDDDL